MGVFSTFYVDLSSFISESKQEVIDQKSTIRNKTVTDFLRQVQDQGLSYEAQAEFWQTQNDKEASSEFPNADFLKENKDNVSLYKKMQRAQTYRDSLSKKTNDILSQKNNYEDLQAWLEGQLSSAVDMDLRTEINTQLEQTKTTILQNNKDAVESMITRGERDRSIDILDQANLEVDKQLSKAISSGSTDLQAYWNLRKSTITQDKNTVIAQNSINNFQLGQIRGDSPTKLLDTINNSINGVQNDTTNIFIEGVKYSGIKNYLETQRSSYVNDASNNGFLYKLRKQDSDFLDSVSNKVGIVPDSTIDALVSTYNTLKTRPELAGISGGLDNILYDANGLITKAVNQNVSQILSNYTADLDFQKAAKELSRLSQKYQIDTQAKMNSLIVDNSGFREKLMNNIVGIAEQLYQGTATNPSTLTWQQAVEQATQGYIGGIYSPNDLVSKSIYSLALDMEKTGPKQVRATPATIPTGSDVTPQQTDVGTPPTTQQTQPAPAPAAPSTPNVPGSADYEKALDTIGDTKKQQTMAGWGYQWQYSDDVNKIGGYVPVSTAAKSKFKSNYGTDFVNKKMTLGLGTKKVVSFAYKPYSSGLELQGYKLI